VLCDVARWVRVAARSRTLAAGGSFPVRSGGSYLVLCTAWAARGSSVRCDGTQLGGKMRDNDVMMEMVQCRDHDQVSSNGWC
jgi:hypothetical protein